MGDHNKYKHESQDARRHDKHLATHPEEKVSKAHHKSKQKRK